MVQFELKLQENVVEKWKQYYLDYQKLKNVLKPEKDKKKDKKDKKKKDKKDQEKDADEFKSRSGGHARIPLGEQSGLLSRSNSETDLKSGKGWLRRNFSFENLKFTSSQESKEGYLSPEMVAVAERLPEKDRPRTVFERALFVEVHKFCSFYTQKKADLDEEFNRYSMDMTGRSANDLLGLNRTTPERPDSPGGDTIQRAFSPSPSRISPGRTQERPGARWRGGGSANGSDDGPGTTDQLLESGQLSSEEKAAAIAEAQATLPPASAVPLAKSPARRESAPGNLEGLASPPLLQRSDSSMRSFNRRNRHSRRRALSSLYKEMLEFKDFSGLNYTAVIKIVKKAKKTLASPYEDYSSADEEGGARQPSATIDELGKSAARIAAHSGPIQGGAVRAGAKKKMVGFGPTKLADGTGDLLTLATAWMTAFGFDQSGVEVQLMLKGLERLWSKLFCDGDLQLGMGELEAASQSDRYSTLSYELLKLGFRMGVAMAAGIWVLWDCVIQGLKQKQGVYTIDNMSGFPALCALAGLLLAHWSWGIQVWVWTRFRVNYVYVFELDPRYVRSYIKIFNDCALDSIALFVCCLLYFKTVLKRLPARLAPGAEGVFIVLGFVYALQRSVFPWTERRGLWAALFRVACPWTAPTVTFFHTYLGDVLTSMVKCFLNFAFTTFYVASGDVWLPSQDFTTKQLNAAALAKAGASEGLLPWNHKFWYTHVLQPGVVFLPLWFRFIQCLIRQRQTGDRWPHQFNALKYGLMMTVTLFGALHPLYTTFQSTVQFQLFWIALFTISTLYSAYWDICVDWGLGKVRLNFLNDRQMYPERWWYYGAMVLDLALRFVWLYTLVPPQTQNGNTSGVSRFYVTAANWFAPIAMLLEMVRRTVWGFFRLENEQLRNTEGYRRVNFVPLHFDHAPERLTTKGWSVVMEVVGFGVTIVSAGAVIILISSRRLAIADHIDSQPADDDGPDDNGLGVLDDNS